jgi:hypothetical protein
MMNERIKELAKQAMVEYPHEMGGKYMGFSKDKFAELIVKECIDAVLTEGQSYAIKSAGEHQSKWFANAIKKHFGVE